MLAVAFATKETTYITVFCTGTFLVAVLAVQLRRGRRRGRPWREAELVAAVRGLGLDAWVWGVATFLAVYTALFTTFFTNPQGLREGLYGSIEYWLGQQPVNRGSQPWFYYLVTIPAYEWPILLLGVLGAVVALRRRTLFGLLLIWLAVTQLAVYSWASERMPWLTLHILLPFVLLAASASVPSGRRGGGSSAGRGWSRSRWPPFSASTRPSASPSRGPQTRASCSSSFSRRRTSRASGGDRRAGQADVARRGTSCAHRGGLLGRVAWPWAWYLRDLPADYVDLSTNPVDEDVDAVLLADVNRPARLRELRGFRGHRFDLRSGGSWTTARRGPATGRAGSRCGDVDAARVTARVALRAAAVGNPEAHRSAGGSDRDERQDVEGMQQQGVGQGVRVPDVVGLDGDDGCALEHTERGGW